MRPIDRLAEYLDRKGITPFTFEKTCELGNGYLGKQIKAKGTLGSDVLEKIAQQYPEISLDWLITGKGKMLYAGKRERVANYNQELREEQAIYNVRVKLIESLKEQLQLLEETLPVRRKKRKNSGK